MTREAQFAQGLVNSGFHILPPGMRQLIPFDAAGYANFTVTRVSRM